MWCAAVPAPSVRSTHSQLLQPRRPRTPPLLTDACDAIQVDQLGGVLPVMIEGEHWEGVAEELDDMFLGTARF